MANTAYAEGIRLLYHWQRFDEARLTATLATNTIYCSSPGAFNDPWDCKPHFNSEVLRDPEENAKHVEWAVDLCRRKTRMSVEDIERMRERLSTGHNKAADLMNQMSAAIAPEINQRYRVYCLGPDVGNLLMWSHYAADHKGLCLEFDVSSDAICGALRCEYLEAFPLMKAYDNSEAANLTVLLAKSSVWAYEKEYRLIAQERAQAIRGADTLMTDKSLLQLAPGVIRSVIAGCQADYDSIRATVQRAAPHVSVKKAIRVPNRYELATEG